MLADALSSCRIFPLSHFSSLLPNPFSFSLIRMTSIGKLGCSLNLINLKLLNLKLDYKQDGGVVEDS
jgi:hypothetical protein